MNISKKLNSMTDWMHCEECRLISDLLLLMAQGRDAAPVARAVVPIRAGRRAGKRERRSKLNVILI